MYKSEKVSLIRPQILAGNKIAVLDLWKIEDLITFPYTLLCDNMFYIPAPMIEEVQAKLSKNVNCLASMVLPLTCKQETEGLLEPILITVLKTGLLLECILGFYTLGIGLPESATKHLLGIKDEKDRQQFTCMLKRFADV